jgi:hypothetical protein
MHTPLVGLPPSRGKPCRTRPAGGAERPKVRAVRLVFGLMLVLGSVTSVALLLHEGYSARAMVVLGLTLILTSVCGLWFAIRGTWD